MIITKKQISEFVERLGQPEASVLLSKFFNQYRSCLDSCDVAQLYDEEFFTSMKNKRKQPMTYDYLPGKITPQTTILDLGCGTGDFVLAMAKQGPSLVVGVDFSEKSVEAARVKIENAKLSNCSFYSADLAKNDSLPHSNFDYVILNDVSEHLSDNEFSNLLEGINRVIADNGELVIYTPNGLALCYDTVTNALQYFYKLYMKVFRGYKGHELSEFQLYYGQVHINIKSFKELSQFLKKFGYKSKVYYEKEHRFCKSLSTKMLVVATKR